MKHTQPLARDTKTRNLLFYFILLAFFLPGLTASLQAQVATTQPAIPIDTKPLTIFLNTAGTELDGYTGDIYAHTGINNWANTIGNWGANAVQPKLTHVEGKIYKLEITPSIRQFYNVAGTTKIEHIAIVFRSAASPYKQTRPDIFIPVYEEGLNLSFIAPVSKSTIVEHGTNLDIQVTATAATSLKLYLDDALVGQSDGSSAVSYTFKSSDYGYGSFWAIAKASDATTELVDSSYIFVRSQPQIAELPADVIPGINYIDDTTVTLVLQDPPASKSYAFVIGDFNDWKISEQAYMKRTPDSKHFWLTITDLEPAKEYGFQYYIDGNLRIADPYTHKVLDPWNDDEIRNQGRYPGLIPYPKGKTEHPASVFQTARTPYQWKNTNFTPPAVEDLVIYELLIRDFLANSTYETLRDTLNYLKNLGVNAIELMPVTEFEGNLSWGYNPSFFFAADKYYGPRRELKKFIDEAHGMGIAVILDMVWNHSFGQSPLLRMYFDSQNNRPAADNPWYSLPIFQNSAMNFGYKFDHGSPHFIEFMDRANQFWLEEYRIDGFRFDLTKGFTTRFKGSNDDWGSNYDQERVDNLVRMYNQIKSVNPNAYVILEHLADNSEEVVLANAGMLLWGNMNHSYRQAAKGESSNFNGGSYKNRAWNDPHLIIYMESHDEERMMFDNLTAGNNTNPAHNTRDLFVALRRMELAATFFFTIPGPKMIWQFGELGYDVSINFNGRTGNKPLKWEYYDDWKHKRLYDIYAALIDLKKEHDVFRTTDFALFTSSPLKRIHLNHATNKVTVLGNFNVTEAAITPNFQQTGTWYEFFTRETLEVTDVTQSITLKPGEYRLYSTVPFPDHGLSLNSGFVKPGQKQHHSVFPNPSSEGFTFSLDAQQDHSLQIINLQGQVVFQQDKAFNATQNSFHWNAIQTNGQAAAKGIYFYRIFSREDNLSGKIVIR